MKAILLSTATLLLTSGCASVQYSQTKPDGTRVEFSTRALFSNSALRGLTVDGVTKTTSQGLRITSNATEPNAESITATGATLGELIGTAAKAAATK